MTPNESKQKKFRWCLVRAILLPLLLFSIYLFFSRWPTSRFTAFSEWIAIAISLFVGGIFIVLLPLKTHERAISLLVYLLVFLGLLVLYEFLFVAMVFHEGL